MHSGLVKVCEHDYPPHRVKFGEVLLPYSVEATASRLRVNRKRPSSATGCGNKIVPEPPLVILRRQPKAALVRGLYSFLQPKSGLALAGRKAVRTALKISSRADTNPSAPSLMAACWTSRKVYTCVEHKWNARVCEQDSTSVSSTSQTLEEVGESSRSHSTIERF